MRNLEPLIAVVDDEAPVRAMLGRVLRLEHFRVAEFASGDVFLAALNVQLPVCAIVDVHMPGLSGFEVLARMRSAKFEVPVVFITGSDEVALPRLALQRGAVQLLRKPFSSVELLAAIGAATTD